VTLLPELAIRLVNQKSANNSLPHKLPQEKTPDSTIKDHFTLLTDLPLDRLPDHPRAAQKLLAPEVVSIIGGESAASWQKAI
jgi:tyrosyl-tRNA synthetase